MSDVRQGTCLCGKNILFDHVTFLESMAWTHLPIFKTEANSFLRIKYRSETCNVTHQGRERDKERKSLAFWKNGLNITFCSYKESGEIKTVYFIDMHTL